MEFFQHDRADSRWGWLHVRNITQKRRIGHFQGDMARPLARTPAVERPSGTGVHRRSSVPLLVTPPMDEEESDGGESLMDKIVCEYDSDSSKGKLTAWIDLLQQRVVQLEYNNKDLQDYIQETKASTEMETNKILGRTMKQCEKDPRTFRKINALVVDTIFPMKKFVKSQDELDDFNAHNGLGMVIMEKMKVEKPDRLQFWNAYKEIVADAIATRRTTIANELKKVVMSKFRQSDIDVDGDSHY